MKPYRNITSTLLVAAGMLVAVPAMADDTLHRLVAEYQNFSSLGGPDEVATNVAPGAGGTQAYSTAVQLSSVVIDVPLTTK